MGAGRTTLLAQRAPADTGSLSVPDAASPIALDGRLDEPAWARAARLTAFYETSPGDNVAPPVRTEVAVTFDAHFLYLGVWAQDPHPDRIRAAYADRDNVTTTDDYVAFDLDTRGDARAAMIFRVSPRGTQADGVFNEAEFATGNPVDLTPDFAWDAAVAIGVSGWTAELRIPFTTLRYPHRDRQRWGLIVHRVYPRDFLRSFFSVRMPRGTGCFLCHEQPLELAGLPAASALVAAPYAAALGERTADGLHGSEALRAGADLKWTPGTSTAFDATVRPDFSQVEADASQLAVNTQFALFYPEKRPFFLEGADLFPTPLQAAYTRSIAAPDWGARATGALGSTAYTALVTRDRGGGSVILPGPVQSSLVPADFGSLASIARSRTSLPGGFAGLLATDREIAPDGGGGHNRVFGPDVVWSATNTDQLGAQLLASDTRVPVRPDVVPAWDGRRFTSGALDATWHHLDRRAEWFAQYRDIGADFRADNGFVPQVGVRLTNGWADARLYPTGTINWVSPWVQWQHVVDRSGVLVSDYRAAAIQIAGAHSLYVQLRYADERLRALDSLLPRRYVWLYLEASPGRRLAWVTLFARAGGDVDLANARRATSAEVKSTMLLHATDHLELQGLADLEWLDVPVAGVRHRLFTAAVERLRATYNVTARASLRMIVENVRTRRDPTLYLAPTSAEEGGVTLSALFSYRWNWETVAYLGMGADREIAEGTVAPGHEQVFFKLQVARP